MFHVTVIEVMSETEIYQVDVKVTFLTTDEYVIRLEVTMDITYGM
jgi:hypothetical protein